MNERIKRSEEEKKKLNIQFNPFSRTPQKERKTTINHEIDLRLASSTNIVRRSERKSPIVSQRKSMAVVEEVRPAVEEFRQKTETSARSRNGCIRHQKSNNKLSVEA